MTTSKFTFPALISVAMTLMPVLTGSFITYQILVNEEMLAQLSANQWALITFVCLLTSAFAITPPTFLGLVFGYFLGWNALLPLFALNMGAILLVNLGVRWLDGERLRRSLEQNPKVRRVLAQIDRQELRFIFFAKLSPVLPFAVTNLVFGLSGARLRNVLLGGFLGMVPRTALAVWVGSEARELRGLLDRPDAGGWTKWIIMALLLVSVMGLGRIIMKKTDL